MGRDTNGFGGGAKLGDDRLVGCGVRERRRECCRNRTPATRGRGRQVRDEASVGRDTSQDRRSLLGAALSQLSHLPGETLEPVYATKLGSAAHFDVAGPGEADRQCGQQDRDEERKLPLQRK